VSVSPADRFEHADVPGPEDVVPAYDQTLGVDVGDEHEDVQVPVRAALRSVAAGWVGLAKARVLRDPEALSAVARSLDRRVLGSGLGDALRLQILREAQVQGLRYRPSFWRRADEFHVGARVEMSGTSGNVRASEQGTVTAIQGTMTQVQFDDHQEPLWFDEMLLRAVHSLDTVQPGESDIDDMQELVDEALDPPEEDPAAQGAPAQGEPAAAPAQEKQALVYSDNLGFEEMMRFFQVASPEEQEQMAQLAAAEDEEGVRRLIDDVLGVALMPLAARLHPADALLRQATDFPSEKALKQYLSEHPKADKSKHRVVKPKRTKKQDAPEQQQKPKPDDGIPDSLVPKDEGGSYVPEPYPVLSEEMKARYEQLPKKAQPNPVGTKQELEALVGPAHEAQVDFLDRGKGMDQVLGARVGGFFEKGPDGKYQQTAVDLDAPGPVILIGPPKKLDVAEEKVNSKYGGDWSRLSDSVRATICVDSIDDMPGLLVQLEQQGMKLASRPDDKFEKATSVGYRDLSMNVVFPNGLVGELQLSVKQMQAVKGEGHKYYEVVRGIERQAIQAGRVLPDGKALTTPEEAKIIRAANAKAITLYEDAWSKVQGKRKAMLASGDASVYTHTCRGGAGEHQESGGREAFHAGPDGLLRVRGRGGELVRGDAAEYRPTRTRGQEVRVGGRGRVRAQGVDDHEGGVRSAVRRVALTVDVDRILSGNRGIPRSEMPQIRSDLVSAFLRELEADGIRVDRGSDRIDSLRATQSEIHPDRVMELVEDPSSAQHLRKPVIVSSEGYLLDGHHRWAALMVLDSGGAIPTIRVDLPIDDLLERAHAFGGVSYKARKRGGAVAPVAVGCCLRVAGADVHVVQVQPFRHVIGVVGRAADGQAVELALDTGSGLWFGKQGRVAVAVEHPADRLLRLAREFGSDEALKRYLSEHPKADKSKHRVVKPKRTRKPDEGSEQSAPKADEPAKQTAPKADEPSGAAGDEPPIEVKHERIPLQDKPTYEGGKRGWLPHYPGLPKYTNAAYKTADGEYIPERQKLHKEIVHAALDGTTPVPKGQRPKALVMMGGTASGKTTLVKKTFRGLGGEPVQGEHVAETARKQNYVMVNSDDVKEQLPEFEIATSDPKKSAEDAAWMVHEESGDVAKQVYTAATDPAAPRNLVFDGTGANGAKYAEMIKTLKARGYQVDLMFADVPNPDDAVKRAQERADKTGRFVPELIARDIHDQITGNFEELAELADNFTMYATEPGQPHRAVYKGSDGTKSVEDQGYLDQFRERAKQSIERAKQKLAA
jgi:predicted ABC-type ATPase